MNNQKAKIAVFSGIGVVLVGAFVLFGISVTNQQNPSSTGAASSCPAKSSGPCTPGARFCNGSQEVICTNSAGSYQNVTGAGTCGCAVAQTPKPTPPPTAPKVCNANAYLGCGTSGGYTCKSYENTMCNSTGTGYICVNDPATCSPKTPTASNPPTVTPTPPAALVGIAQQGSSCIVNSANPTTLCTSGLTCTNGKCATKQTTTTPAPVLVPPPAEKVCTRGGISYKQNEFFGECRDGKKFQCTNVNTNEVTLNTFSSCPQPLPPTPVATVPIPQSTTPATLTEGQKLFKNSPTCAARFDEIRNNGQSICLLDTSAGSTGASCTEVDNRRAVCQDNEIKACKQENAYGSYSGNGIASGTACDSSFGNYALSYPQGKPVDQKPAEIVKNLKTFVQNIFDLATPPCEIYNASEARLCSSSVMQYRVRGNPTPATCQPGEVPRCISNDSSQFECKNFGFCKTIQPAQTKITKEIDCAAEPTKITCGDDGVKFADKFDGQTFDCPNTKAIECNIANIPQCGIDDPATVAKCEK